jgi:triphosphoribosyl-dephospho-CoA synthase
MLGAKACVWEASARKVGNVHPQADFSDTTYLDFVLSAAAIQESLRRAAAFDVSEPSNEPTLGRWIEWAVEDSQMAVGKNTNLGIVLLLMPLAASWDRLHQTERRKWRMNKLLSRLTVADTQCVFRAIRHANPGGLGDAPEQDVNSEPTVTLLEAMKLAADRDMVARQYANGFADVFDFGVPAFLNGFEKFGCVEAAIIDSQLRWLAEYPDSLIARKKGNAVAVEVQQRAREVQQLGGIATVEGRRAGVALDKHLRSDGNKLNPGTTADLITACLFVALRENKVAPNSPFRWEVSDWL